MRSAPLVFLIALAPPCVSAQSVSPAADLATKLRAGDTVYVLDTSSRETTGVLGKTSDSALTLMVDGQLRDIPLSQVRQIARRGGDSLWNGILIGASVGAFLGGASQGAEFILPGVIFYGGIGGLIDWGRRGRVVVYRAPRAAALNIAPYLAGDRRGVRISLSF